MNFEYVRYIYSLDLFLFLSESFLCTSDCIGYLHFDFSYTIKEPEDAVFGTIDKNGTWSGIIAQLINKVFNKLYSLFITHSYLLKMYTHCIFALSYQVQFPFRGRVGQKTKNAIINHILQEVDFAAGSITITKDRSDVVNFMTPFWFDPYSLMIGIPEKNTWRVYTNLFSVSQMLVVISGKK